MGLRIPFAGARALGTASGRSGIGAVAGRKRTCLIDSGDELVEEAGRAGVLGWDGWARGGRGEVAERVGGPGAGARRVKEEVAGAENARVSYLPRMNFSSCESRSDSSREVGGLCDGSMSRDRSKLRKTHGLRYSSGLRRALEYELPRAFMCCVWGQRLSRGDEGKNARRLARETRCRVSRT